MYDFDDKAFEEEIKTMMLDDNPFSVFATPYDWYVILLLVKVGMRETYLQDREKSIVKNWVETANASLRKRCPAAAKVVTDFSTEKG